MIKMLLFLGVTAAAVGSFLSGAVEVQFHPEKFANVPQATVNAVVSGDLLEKGRVLAVKSKRWVSVYTAEHPDQKMELMLSFVRDDAERLEELMAKNPSPQKIVPQAKLLASSVENAREQAWKLSESQRTNLEAVSNEAYEKADIAMNGLKDIQQKAEESSRQLANIVDDISGEEGEVAGSSTQQSTPPPGEEGSSSLQF